MNFEQLGIDEDFNPFYEEVNIKEPNEVQLNIIPKVLEGKSLVCAAQTGSGKTLSYALPIAEMIKLIEDEQGVSDKKGQPLALVIVPTKELANQVWSVFKKLSYHVGLRVRELSGGQSPKRLANLKESSYEILIATPHKLGQSLKKKSVNLSDLKYIVFDEADTLFEMGFKKDIESVLKPVEYDQTQFLFFSATIPESVQSFLNGHFRKKTLENISFKGAHQVQKKVETFNVFSKLEEKFAFLHSFLSKTAKGRGIVFYNQKNQVDEIATKMKQTYPKLKLSILHGGLDAKQRIKNLNEFKDGKTDVLFATDVAARGIDISDLKWVFNWNLPKNAEFYLHRCGRVARANRSGLVYNLVTGHDSKLIAIINNAIKNQGLLDMDTIKESLVKIEKKTQKRPVKKQKVKRVKVTKRSRL